MEEFQKVMTGPIKSYLIKFIPYAPRAAIDSPIAECTTISGASMTEADVREYVDNARSMEELNDLASGFTVGHVDGSRVFVAALGWESHVNFHFPIKGFSDTNTH
ncbi:hypothetical protein LZ30DRAFT_724883 [Colletotrichum cereale]|nr:hypothetical protein LZ30DRAFT_724883 [Colletotrichum cereale]